MKTFLICIFVGIVCCLPIRAYSLDRFDIITTQEMKKLLDERDAGKTDFIFVNTLDEIIYRDSSIPGSINVPLSKIEEHAARLGEDKEKLIITY